MSAVDLLASAVPTATDGEVATVPVDVAIQLLMGLATMASREVTRRG